MKHSCIFDLLIEERKEDVMPMLKGLHTGTTTDKCELCRRFSRVSPMLQIRYLEYKKSLNITTTASRIRPLETVVRCRW